ncbi:uncharacterized protein PFL1_03982 [Pseudozyma flocculosa PF-1]|uniref:VanZ-like domain-containing protein n=2 Tax=Pseudozyma flocculosa TaxID=84751 RepID=A0A5C3F056_9BASI|nr:uncharacterized protein PFL1_03982 [Pseudozyma flocculosa PF-1]EPQ28679.1 hypothetical protein PFL1_03982 [Pseudozyma flocculosa PF-1]SPO36631.1 uncharacterized protein PSFLO_02102 [Pseudozyma flocculosa]
MPRLETRAQPSRTSSRSRSSGRSGGSAIRPPSGGGYLGEVVELVTPSSSASGRRWEHLKSLALRSVRIKLASETGGLDGQPVVPLRVRPAFIVLNVLDLVFLGLLGFHPNGQAWTRLNDKVLHFICFFFATSLFYMVWDVDESARRVWIWRNAALLLTFLTCFACGSIGSEIVQSLLPYKRFDIYDVLCNMVGSSLGLFFTYHLELRYRARREVERLYDPLDVEEYGDGFASDDDDDVVVDVVDVDVDVDQRHGGGGMGLEAQGEGGGGRRVRFDPNPTVSSSLPPPSHGSTASALSPTTMTTTTTTKGMEGPHVSTGKTSEQLFSIDDDDDDDDEGEGEGEGGKDGDNVWSDAGDPLRS